jgi:hypothetical protein
MRQVHFAFRPQEGALTGGHGAYRVKAEGGQVSVTASAEGSSETLVLETVSVAREGQELAAAREVRAGVGRDGSLELQRGAVLERWRNEERGSEQRWEFAERPQGRGDLRVVVSASGTPYAGEDARGLKFGSRGALRYGQAFWVDATGARTRVSVEHEGEALVLTVPGELVDGSRFPAALDPLVSPEFGLEPPLIVEAVFDRESPRVAFDGTNYLVVWADERAEPTEDFFNFTSMLFGARVAPDGTVLDPVGFIISPSLVESPNVAAGVGQFLVTWAQPDSFNPQDIYGARVGSDGQVLDTTPVRISRGGRSRNPSVAFDGARYFVVWNDSRASSTVYDIYGAQVTPDGTVVQASDIAIATGSANQVSPGIASGGGVSLVTYVDSGKIVARLYDSNGVLLGSELTVTSSTQNQDNPAVAFGGGNFLIVWRERYSSSSSNTAIQGRLVTPSGGLLGAGATGISTVLEEQWYPSVAFNGTEFLVVWNTTSGVNPDIIWKTVGARVTTDGSVVSGSLLTLAEPTTFYYFTPAVASDGSGWLALSVATQLSDVVRGSRVLANGTLATGSPFVLSRSANLQRNVAVAFDGTQYLVVWEDLRGGDFNPRLYAARVAPDGVVKDPAGIALCTTNSRQTLPSVTFDGSQFLVVWADDRNAGKALFGTRVSADGTVRDPAGFLVASEYSDISSQPVASNGTESLVVYSWSAAGYFTYAVRVSQAGATLGAPVRLSTSSSTARNASVAWTGSEYLAVWQDSRPPAQGWELYGTRVSATGVPVDTVNLPIALALADQTEPRLSCHAGACLVLWQDARNGSASPALYATRVRADGTVSDASGVRLVPSANSQTEPAVTFNGAAYLAAWHERSASGTSEVRAVRVDEGGAVLAPGPSAVSGSPFFMLSPAVAAGGVGKALIAFHRFDTSPGVMAQRVKAVTWETSGALGADCENTLECQSGFCVDGVCCDSACGGGSTTDCQACSVAAGASANGVCSAVTVAIVCRPVASVCDGAEVCDGSSSVCPADVSAKDGTACNDGNACTQTDSCQSGACMGTDPRVCTAQDACHVAGTCDPASGTCSNAIAPDGTACTEGTCNAGLCSAPLSSHVEATSGCGCAAGTTEGVASWALLLGAFLAIRSRSRRGTGEQG